MVTVVSGARAAIEHAKTVLTAWHKVVAKFGWLAPVYLKLVASVCRTFLDFQTAARIGQLVTGDVAWPKIAFLARAVTVGKQTKIMLTPHLGEPDQAALFTKALDYARPVFCWLEQNPATSYDLVIEIGASVGIYSVFSTR